MITHNGVQASWRDDSQNCFIFDWWRLYFICTYKSKMSSSSFFREEVCRKYSQFILVLYISLWFIQFSRELNLFVGYAGNILTTRTFLFGSPTAAAIPKPLSFANIKQKCLHLLSSVRKYVDSFIYIFPHSIFEFILWAFWNQDIPFLWRHNSCLCHLQTGCGLLLLVWSQFANSAHLWTLLFSYIVAHPGNKVVHRAGCSYSKGVHQNLWAVSQLFWGWPIFLAPWIKDSIINIWGPQSHLSVICISRFSFQTE